MQDVWPNLKDNKGGGGEEYALFNTKFAIFKGFFQLLHCFQ